MNFKDILKRTGQSSVVQAVKRFLDKLNAHGLYNRSAELAYYLVVALLTLIVTLVYGAHFIPNLIQTIDERFLTLLPDDIKDIIVNALYEVKVPHSYWVIFVTTVTSIWFTSRAMHSIMVSLDRIYHVTKNVKVIKTRAFSVLFTLSLIGVFLVVFFLTIIESTLSNLVFKYFGYEAFFSQTGRWISQLVSAVMMFVVFDLIYYYLPSNKMHWYNTVPGAVFATGTWFLMARGFSYYVNSINHFSWILGSLGSIFVFLIWIYYCAIFLFYGAEINSFVGAKVEAKKFMDEKSPH